MATGAATLELMDATSLRVGRGLPDAPPQIHGFELADEAARQRKLTSQSLADIDLLGRSVKTVQLQETFAMAGANTAARARREPTPGWGDLLGGIMRAVAGEK